MLTDIIKEAVNSTAGIILGAAVETVKAKLSGSGSAGILPGTNQTLVAAAAGGAGAGQDVVGLGWLRSLLGRSEWTVPCVNVKIRL